MAALTASRDVPHYPDQELREYAVEAAKKIYRGGFLGFSADGHAQPLIAIDNKFAGIAYEEVDNLAGADAAKKVRAYTMGDFQHALAGATKANIRAAVYATDDGTLTLTSTSNTYVGFIVDVPVAGEIILRLDVGRTAP
jgi:hypothetical protein